MEIANVFLLQTLNEWNIFYDISLLFLGFKIKFKLYSEDSTHLIIQIILLSVLR